MCIMKCCDLEAKSAVDSSSDDSDDSSSSSSSDEDLDSNSEHSDEEDYCFMVGRVVFVLHGQFTMFRFLSRVR